ncbi:MAG: orotidine-5'-phosphate decarboxylase [Cytophagales bacterium]|nr:MAG: orotidine-5'-phosphate decarboxylase [Cytophagales bacterium]TAF60602.1 MAG: orotidine-5'-phosphate decarboxylase [Cytophagales bacterium]
MNKQELIALIKRKRSFLCVGLDTDITKLPTAVWHADDPVFEFNKQIIEATAPYAVAYKPNLAFYEAQGTQGWESLVKTLKAMPPDVFVIADAKRADIGNTSLQYAKGFFEDLGVHAITIAPYMGADSVKPFLSYPNCWTVLLALTSNSGSADFQLQKLENGKLLFEEVLTTSSSWGTDQNMMYVVGATNAAYLQRVRAIVPDHFLLVPGVGAQGGSLEEVAKNGLNKDIGLLVNSSRDIIFASSDNDFAEVAAQKAQLLQGQMAHLMAHLL